MECKLSLGRRARLTALISPILQFENSLRRHNHVGLVHALLLGLAKGGGLSSAQEEAKKIMQVRIDRQKSRGQEMDED